jgi:hypothetical protein
LRCLGDRRIALNANFDQTNLHLFGNALAARVVRALYQQISQIKAKAIGQAKLNRA